MYLDKETISALYNSEDLVLEAQYEEYLLSCLEMGETALVILDALKVETSVDFAEQSSKFIVEVEEENPEIDIDYAISILDFLSSDNAKFKEIFETLLTELNNKLIETVSSRDPEALNRIDKSIIVRTDSAIKAYTDVFITPEIEEEEQKDLDSKIAEINSTLEEQEGASDKNRNINSEDTN